MADGSFWLSPEGRFMGVPQSISNYYLKTHRKELACAAVRIAHTEWRKCKWLVLQVLTYPEKNVLRSA